MPTTVSSLAHRRERPRHMPTLPCAWSAYRPLFDATFNIPEPVDSALFKRIPVGSTEREVYALLPRARDFEYGGYITGHGVYCHAGEAFLACPPRNKLVTWHSHPCKYSGADYPSAMDLYIILKWFPVRHIIVGRDIWVFDKTRRTLPIIRDLLAWDNAHMVDCMLNAVVKYRFPRSTHELSLAALKDIGFDFAATFKGHPAHEAWVSEVQKRLKLRVRRFAIGKSARIKKHAG